MTMLAVSFAVVVILLSLLTKPEVLLWQLSGITSVYFALQALGLHTPWLTVFFVTEGLIFVGVVAGGVARNRHQET